MGLGALLLCAEESLAHLDIGSIEIPERGEGSRQSLRAVPDPQGLEMARRDSRLLAEALGAIRGRSAPTPPFPLQHWSKSRYAPGPQGPRARRLS